MTFEEIIKGFGEKIGGAIELAPDSDGIVSLDIDGMELTIMNIPEVGQIALTAPIGEPPPADRKELLYKALLEANHNFAGTAGATISINPETGAVSLCRLISTQLIDIDGFLSAVEGFVNTLETWRKLVTDFRGADLSEKADETAPADSTGFSPLGGFMQV